MEKELVFSWVVDYLLFAAYLSVGVHFFADNDFQDFWILFFFFCYLWVLVDIWIIREWINLTFLPKTIIGKMKEVKWTPQLLWNMITTRIFTFGGATLLCYLGLVYFPWKGKNPILLMLYAQGEAFVANLFRDTIGMYWLHQWMHKHAYYLHKHHHKASVEISSINALYFDWFDLFVENAIGYVITALLKHWIFGQGLLFQAFLFQAWLDLAVHSANPYTPALLNPIGDWFTRPTICHNLHHALSKGYYTVFAWNHIFHPSTRDEDTKKFNAIMQTSVFSNAK